MTVRLVGLTKHYGATRAVERLNLEIAARELMTILGPSGSGKTTVLRMIAGYVRPSAGEIIVGGKPIHDLPPEKRDIGMVFQSYALFPHLTVFGNVAFGLERRKLARAEIERRVGETLALVQLSGLEERMPRALSGGQQQRVALARALAIRPAVLLLDEPMSSLDARLRASVRLEIRRLQRQLGITTILVTHDQDEALTMSDRIAVMQGGALEQVATPDELYRRPATRFVAEFIGRMNLLPARRVAGREPGTPNPEPNLEPGTPNPEPNLEPRTSNPEPEIQHAVYVLANGQRLFGPDGPPEAVLIVRPEALAIGPAPPGGEVNTLSGLVAHRVFAGELEEIGVALDGGPTVIVRRIPVRGSELAVGDRVSLWWPIALTAVLP
jgi:putative spermidine/putrescine transport system ATP-binding protein